MENQKANNEALIGGSVLRVELERLLDELQRDWGVGGLDASTMYGEFAMEVARRAVLSEREACAKVCELLPSEYGEFSTEFTSGEGYLCASKIRERSNK